ncbi:toll/interleukin-1 receptor domain-containing protein [Enterococcus sp. 5H]|uniref:toll/interleukin-1 receptor domain-containing protein n=1 Tax=Enterococcus sp. 5H TaxID=1229490 RepID=UPI002302C0DA|nr:toll/interleukin-1 receptor domain-containing protein [Enterococcus sp. 5H]MDA9470641.1 hypothetical protein [Enterococcus sp. 5H]
MIFMCFSSKDRYYTAQSISFHLQNFGLNVWYDYQQLHSGDDKLLLNFTLPFDQCQYAVVIVSDNLFNSPCAVDELDRITVLYDKNKLVVIPVFLNFPVKNLSDKYSWMNNLIYYELKNNEGTLMLSKVITARILNDRRKSLKFSSFENFLKAYSEPCFFRDIIEQYTKLDKNNLCARMTLLHSLSQYFFYEIDKKFEILQYKKIITQMYTIHQLNLHKDFYELEIMENTVLLLLNLNLCDSV